jgi:hypothetical protein
MAEMMPPVPVAASKLLHRLNAQQVSKQREADAVLRAYHDLAVRVHEIAARQEARAKELAELARLARTDPATAQRKLRELRTSPTVWDFGNAVTELRALLRRSEKVLK